MGNKYEAEIDLQDMCLYVLCKWRTLLLSALVLGILGGGYKFLLNTLDAMGESGKSQEIRLYEIALEQYELSKSSYEREIADYQMRLKEHEAYMDNSVLMHTDPYHKPTASADIFVKLDGAEWEHLPDGTALDPADSLIAVYTSNFLSNIDWEPIEQLTGLEEIYLKELLFVSADYNSNTFTVGAVYNDGSAAQQILDLVVDQILTKAPDIDANVNRHTLSVVNKSLSYNMDTSLADIQKANADATSEFQLAILNRQNSLEDMTKPKRPHSVRKFFLLGLAAGVFLMSMFHAAVYLLGGKLHSEEELRDRYGYCFLGTIHNFDSAAHWLFINRLFNKWRGRKNCLSKEEACRLIAVKISSQTNSGEKILITGTIAPEKLQSFAKEITSRPETILLDVVSDVNTSADNMKALIACDAIVLVEERHKSFITNIEKEQETISMLHKKVIGYVLL